MAAAVLYGLLTLATATVVRKDGPGWVDLIVLLAFWNTVKFTCLIPVSLIRLVRVRHQERIPMTEHSRLPSDPRIAERAIVLQLLRDDHDERWSRTELQAEVSDARPAAHHHSRRNAGRHDPRTRGYAGQLDTPQAHPRLVEEQHRRLADEARGEVQAPAHAS
jgi:hypothetical protein